MRTLITGATGYLGKELVETIAKESPSDFSINDNLVLLGHSEKRADELGRKHNTKVHIGEISDSYFADSIELRGRNAIWRTGRYRAAGMARK